MQPIDPPLGGGRVRLLGVYHALGMPTTYVGTYDWPGPGFRRHFLSPSLEEVDVPLSDTHFRLHERWRAALGGATAIDVLFPLQVGNSPNFLHTVEELIAGADIVVFSHPWVYSPLRAAIRPRQLLVYDSHNVEGLIRSELFIDTVLGREVGRFAAVTEYQLATECDLLLTCSREDADSFRELYGVPAEKTLVVPNGTFVDLFSEPDETDRATLRRELGAAGPVVAFMGSGYGPNLEAARFVCAVLAPALPHATFIVLGNVGGQIPGETVPANVRILGLVDEPRKRRYLSGADAAVNPMFSGSGTNIKMFDYMAARLPIVTTPVGARGIERPDDAFQICEPDEMADALGQILSDPGTGMRLGRGARALVEKQFSWERISPSLGANLEAAFESKREGARERGGAASFPRWGLRLAACGGFRPGSGLLELIQAVRLLDDELGGVQLVVIGDMEAEGDAAAYLQRCNDLIEELGLRRQVGFKKAPARQEELLEALSACDGIVLPLIKPSDRFTEDLKTAVRAGKPIVTPAPPGSSPLEYAAYRVESADPYLLALAAGNIACNPIFAHWLVEKARVAATREGRGS